LVLFPFGAWSETESPSAKEETPFPEEAEKAAAEAVRGFLELGPDKSVPKPVSCTGPHLGPNPPRAIYVFRLPGGSEKPGTPGSGNGMHPCLVCVDARSKEVIMALFPLPEGTKLEKKLNIVSAERIAMGFAQKHYPLWERKLAKTYAKFRDHGDAGQEYLFTWDEITDGVKTGNSVTVTVDAGSGQVRSYAAQFQPHPVEKPKITKEEALRILQEALPKEIQLRKIIDSQLAAISPFTKPGRPVWHFDLLLGSAGDPGGPDRRWLALVDAVEGRLIYPATRSDWGLPGENTQPGDNTSQE